MKILICTIELPPMIGGAGIYLENVISTLKKNDLNQITLICPENSREEVIKNVNHVYFSKPILRSSMIGHLYCLRKLNLQYFDKIIVNDLTYALIFSFILSNKYNKKIVYFAHGLEPELVFSHPRKLYKFINFKKSYQVFLTSTFKNIFVSKDLIKKFDEICNYRRHDDTVCYSQIHHDDFLPVDNTLNLPSRFLLSTGRIIEGKGYYKMSLIAANLLGKDPDLHWIIIGDGPYKQTLINDTNLQTYRDRVLILEKVDRPRLSTYYSRCSAFFLLSTFRESLGLVYLEAKSFGAICFANNMGGVSEILDEFDYLFDPYESVENITKKLAFHLNQELYVNRCFRDIPTFSKALFEKIISNIFK